MEMTEVFSIPDEAKKMSGKRLTPQKPRVTEVLDEYNV